MPPHCDTMDGPVVKAARRALETGNANLIFPWVPKETEQKLEDAFTRVLSVRKLGDEARELADYWFFETAVRLHREGEGAPYTGLKPAGLDPGPVVPMAERAIDRGDAREIVEFLSHTVEEALQEKFKHVMVKRRYDVNNVGAAREYIEAMLGFVLYAHHLYMSVVPGSGHREHGQGAHGH